jgi:hypothetical protein
MIGMSSMISRWQPRGIAGLVGVACWVAPQAAPAEGIPSTGFLANHCVRCHAADEPGGGIRLDTLPASAALSTAAAERWQQVLNVLNSGEMPPDGEPQPLDAEKLAFLDWLSAEMVTARKKLADAGGRHVMRRLNRREYTATIRDLLGVEVDAESLPSDAGSGGFDTVGSSLYLSSDQIGRYLAIARQALRDATRIGERPEAKRQRIEPESREMNRWQHGASEAQKAHELAAAERYAAWKASPERSIKEFGFPHETEALFRVYCWQCAAPFSYYIEQPLSRSGAYLFNARHDRDEVAITIPDTAAPGRYMLRFRAGHVPGVPRDRQFVDILGGSKQRIGMRRIVTRRIAAEIDTAEIVELPITLDPESDHEFHVVESRNHRIENYPDFVLGEFLKPDLTPGDPRHATVSLWLDWIEWEGPLVPQWPPASYARVFPRGPDEPPTADYAREIIGSFVRRAFRGREPDPEFLDKIVKLQERHAAGKSFTDSIVESLAVVLASPSFLYLTEPLPAGVEPDRSSERQAKETAKRQLTDQEFAVRLSYFLWGSPPDDRLLARAASDDLRKPDVLAAEVNRLLDDPRSRGLVDGFVPQWLHLERLDFFQFDVGLHERFNEGVKASAREQILATVHWLLDENMPVRHLLDSREAVVDDRMAVYYGIPDDVLAAGSLCRDPEWRRVTLPEGSPRGGLLGTAGVLAMGSNGKRTSPVERGAFILRILLDEPPPPAPANVPMLSRLDGKPMSARERLTIHMDQSQCGYCHKKIDPPGFALEHFDAAGMWRDEELDPTGRKWPIDTAGTLADGTAFADATELKHVLVARSGQFVRGLTEALLEYGMGRKVGFSDETTVAEIADQCRRDDDRLRTLIHAIVAHPVFGSK